MNILSPPPEYIKDPAAILDYRIDLSSWLATGEVVTSGTVLAETGLDLDSWEFTDNSVTGWLSGGTNDTRYAVTFHWTTNQGREDERTIIIYAKDR